MAGLVLTGTATPPAMAAGGNGGAADLSVRMTAEPRVAQPGQPILYQVRVGNAGPGDAVLPVLRITLPAGVEIGVVDVASCRPGRTRNEVLCPSATDVLAGEGGGVRVSGVVRPDAVGPLRAVATLTSEVWDDDETDNVAVVSTPVDEGADLRLRLRAMGGYRLAAVLRNLGPRAVRRPLVVFRTGARRFVSAGGGSCRRRAVYVLCRVGGVASGERARLELTLRPSRRAVTARVFAARVGDRRPADNVARVRPRP